MSWTVDDKSVLITGGTGSLGHALVSRILATTRARRVIVYSRDELKQYEMQRRFQGESRLRFFIGDVRDAGRLHRAFDGVQLVIHAAAMKHIAASEYNPFEAVKTNIQGAQNIIDAAIDCGVQKVVALSTDKASSPVNLYGATKLVSDRLFVAGNAYAGSKSTRFAVVRYGNVLGSSGSVIPLFRRLAQTGVIPVTDERMTRFWITLNEAADFVMSGFERMQGGEVFVPKIPSMKIVDLAHAIAPDARIEVVGIRPGEKLHEEMISASDARRCRDMGCHYVLEPEFSWWSPRASRGTPVADDFWYTSDRNTEWLDAQGLADKLAQPDPSQRRSQVPQVGQ